MVQVSVTPNLAELIPVRFKVIVTLNFEELIRIRSKPSWLPTL